jgi:pimeloyl-ACP methyl ester carboxylesterase
LNFVKQKHSSQKILFVGLSNGAHGLSQYRDSLLSSASAFIYISGGYARPFPDQLPTLLVWGTEDKNIPYESALEIKRLNPTAKLIIGSKSDHSAFLRQHQYFSAEIESWLVSIFHD